MNKLKRLRYALLRAGLEGVALLGPLVSRMKSSGRGVIFTAHKVQPDRGIIFTAHNVSSPCDESFRPNDILSITPEFLEEAIQVSLECGLVPVAAEDLPALLSDPSDTRKFVSFTLDDGYRNNAQFAAPVFNKYGVPFTIFVTAGFVERTRSLWWETAEVLLREMDELEFDFGYGRETVPLRSVSQKKDAFERMFEFVLGDREDAAVAQLDAVARAHGIEPLKLTEELTMDRSELKELAKNPLARFGAHTLTHINLKRATPERLREEIVKSADKVEEYTGKYPRIFSYPYGGRWAAGEREFNAVADAGFPIAVTTTPGIISANSLKTPTAFNRVSLNGSYQKRRYVKAMILGLPLSFVQAPLKYM